MSSILVDSTETQLSSLDYQGMTNDASETPTRKCSFREDKYVNCSNRGLKEIPKLPPGSKHVDLSHNLIRQIHDATFMGLHVIQTLDISDNIVQHISNHSLAGLHSLHTLDLSGNPINSIAQNAFNGLYNMSILHIRHSNLSTISIEDTDRLVSGLDSLKELSLTFRYDFSAATRIYCFCGTSLPIRITKLNSIDTLEIDASMFSQFNTINIATNESMRWNVKSLLVRNSEFCFFSLFSKACFTDMPFLTSLKIYNTLIDYGNFTSTAFSQLTTLQDLTIDQQINSSYYLYRWDPLIKMIFWNISASVSNLTDFKFLTIRGVACGTNEEFPLTDALAPLMESESIAVIDISNNALVANTDSKYFPFSLRELIARGNCLDFYRMFPMLIANAQLEVFDAAYQDNCHSLRTPRQTTNEVNSFKYSEVHGFQLQKYILSHSNNLNDFTFSFNNLKYMDISWNTNMRAFEPLDKRFFQNFYALEYYDLSGLSLDTIENNALNHTGLKYFNLSSNHFGQMGCNFSEQFHNLPAIQDLRLGNNRIKCITEQSFLNLKHLRKLDLSENVLENFDASIRGLVDLELVDLSKNHIQKLSEKNIEELHHLIEGGSNIEIDLSKNTLSCNCESLGFLRALLRSRKHFVGLENYMCTRNGGSIIALKDLNRIVHELERRCASYTTVILLSCIALTVCLAFIAAGVSYRYRWRLRYVYYMTKIQVRPHARGENGDYEKLFEFDAFISYASEDSEIGRDAAIEKLEEGRELKLCVHDVNFEPGKTIAYNIAQGIHGSKRTLLFISKAFLESEWCIYEMNIAKQESNHSDRDVILVIMLEGIPPTELPLTVMNCINTYTYLEYPTENREEDVDLFWNKCADFINGD